MNQKLSEGVDLVFKYFVFLVALITPLFFYSATSEFYETPKFLALIGITGVLLVLWGVRCVLDGKVSIIHTPIDLPLILLIIVAGVSTFFAVSRPVAIFGNLPRVHGGFASLVLYIIFYLVLVSNIKKVSSVKQIIYVLIGSSIILSLISLLSYFGINVLNLPYSQVVNFTPTGSTFSTTAILALLLPFPIIALLKGNKTEMEQESNHVLTLNKTLSSASNLMGVMAIKVVLSIIITLFLAVIVLTGSMATYVAGALAIILALIAVPSAQIKKSMAFLAFPVVVSIILAVLSFVSLPNLSTDLYQRAQNFPREIQLSFPTSWKVSISAFRDSPFWGSGPSSYLADFTYYKPVEFNSSPYWNIRFDSAFNEYLQVLATLGAPGLICLVLLSAILLSLAFKALMTDQSIIGVALAISTILFVAILLLHASTLVLWVIGAIILVSFMVVHRGVTEQLNIGIAASKALNNQLHLHFDALPEVLLVIILIAVAAVYFFTGRYALADYHHRQALNAVATGNGLQVYNELVTAENLNPNVDLYRTDLAQTNFALANAIAINKGPTEASPTGSLTDEDRQNIQTLLSQSIAEGRNAVALNPNNPINWEILGAIYRQIAGVADNALVFALDSYGRAIQRDPLNPQLRLTVGGVYYATKNYDLAIRFFSDSINLKPDFANGYYNLAVALKDKGDIASAVSAAEQAVSLVDPKSEDYKVASDLLASLKSQQASGTTTPPAAQTNSALDNNNLPKVLDLPKPDSIATPSAIKKPTPTPTP